MLAKHTKHLSLVGILAVGVDRMQRNFEPMQKQVEAWEGKTTFVLMRNKSYGQGNTGLIRVSSQKSTSAG